MIDEVVPPLAPGSFVSPTVVETSTSDHELPSTVIPAPGSRKPVPAASPFPVWLPDSILDELQWVAEQEGRDIADIVVNAVDEFLADHWSRNADIDL